MKVLLINGGPHKNGSTNRALEEIAVTLEKEGIDTEIFWLGTDAIHGCIGCGVCGKTGECFRRDIVNQISNRIDEFDGFIFGSPVHYAASSGALSCFMDRLFFSAGKKFYMKPAAAVVSCRRGGASAAFDEINKYFSICNMPIVTSQYWNMVHGSKVEQVEEDGEGLQTMRSLGKNMAWLLKCIELGKNNNITRPEDEAKIRTNFIR